MIFGSALRLLLVATLNPAHGDVAAHKIVLGFAQVGAESIWRQANTKSVESAAADSGIELIVDNGLQRQENQIRAIRTFILQKVDVIALSPVVKSGWREVLLEAKQKHIPTVLLDRAIDAADLDLVDVRIAADFKEEGRRAAHCLLSGIPAANRTAKTPLRVLELLGTNGASPAIDRRAGFAEALTAHPELAPALTLEGDFKQGVAREKVASLLKSKPHKSFDVIFAHNDDMALGAISALEEAGLKPGRDVFIASVDGTHAAVEAVTQGKLICSVECSPLLGPVLMRTAEALYKHDAIPKMIISPETVFDRSNATDALPGRNY